MTKTTNYQLNQWAKTDRLMMDDFNADNAKIDAALKANADAIAAVGYVTGTYTGTGSYPRTIDLGFTPKAVLIINCYGRTENGMNTYGGLIVPGHVLGLPQYPVAEITEGGFRLLRDYINVNDSLYTYIALC